MPNDTPESRMHQITPFTKCFSTTKPPSNLMYRNAFNSLKKYTPYVFWNKYPCRFINKVTQNNNK